MKTENESWAARRTPGLVVVLSSERSGSTLLRVMLGEHPRMRAPSELFLLRYDDYDTWRAVKPFAMESVLEYFRLIGTPMSSAEVDHACRGRPMIECYRWLLGFLEPETFLVDKTPAYANDIETLRRAEVFEPFYVWLIRHPLGVIESHVRLRERRPGRLVRRRLRVAVQRLSGAANAIARERELKWVLQNANIHSFLRDVPPCRKHVLYFEDLVRDPMRVLGELCEASGVAMEPAMARPPVGALVMHPQLGDPNFHFHDALDESCVDRWRTQYAERSLRFETVVLMRRIGVQSTAVPTGSPPRLISAVLPRPAQNGAAGH